MRFEGKKPRQTNPVQNLKIQLWCCCLWQWLLSTAVFAITNKCKILTTHSTGIWSESCAQFIKRTTSWGGQWTLRRERRSMFWRQWETAWLLSPRQIILEQKYHTISTTLRYSLIQCFSNFFQVGTTFISQNVLWTTLLLGLSNSLGLP